MADDLRTVVSNRVRRATKTVYHIKDGEFSLYIVDAHTAVRNHPKEWSFTPWGRNGDRIAPLVEIPADWQDMKPSERISLAVSLGAKRIGLTSAKADDVIEAEVEKRTAAAAEPQPEEESEHA